VNQQAFFFQGDALLLPQDIPDSQMDRELPLDLLKDFEPDAAVYNPDIFEIPAVEAPGPQTALSGMAAASITIVNIAAGAELPRFWRAVPVRQGLQFLADGMITGAGSFGRLLRAFHIAQWRRESRFCGRCGAQNTDAPVELARLCPACGRLEFPRISPAVITIIINDEGRALLAHNKNFTPGVYSLIAGFNEAGESLEATVAREVREEVNIGVKDIRYEASQPWPFPNSLMLAFSARYASGTVRPDGVEIEDARWFSRDELPKLPGKASVSWWLINRWIEGTL
jgi:NAD+ diphosphatase